MVRFSSAIEIDSTRTGAVRAAPMIAAVLLASLQISACSNNKFVHDRYPSEVKGVGASPSQPFKAAGFKRGAITVYSPEVADMSTEYIHHTSDSQIASTLYVYESPVEQLDELFKTEKANIIRANVDAVLIDETELTFIKNNMEYKALQSTFKYNANFGNKQQTVFSQFVLWKHEDKYLKLRSTSPILQKDQTLEKNTQLINAIDWTQNQ